MTDMTWETAIAEVQEDGLIVRGHRLDDLIEQVSFVEMTFLLIRGDLPSKSEEKMLNALMVTLADHGISPSSIIARILASCGAPLQASLSGAMLSIADWHGGSGERLGEMLIEIVGADAADPLTAEDLRSRSAELVRSHRARKAEVPGFGHPQHPEGDPRATQLLQIAARLEVAGSHCSALRELGVQLAEATGRPHLGRPNVTGALAAILLDLGFAWQSIRGFVIASRVVGLTAHTMEELQQGSRWRHSPASDVTYTGPRPS